MNDPTVTRLIAARDQQDSRIDALKTAALATERDLSEEELTIMRECQTEIARIDSQLEVVTRDTAMTDEARNRIALTTHAVKPVAAYRSGGELLWDVLHQTDADARMRYGTALRRAAEHMGLDAANTTPVAGDLGGLTVSAVVGPVINPVPAGMPFLTGIGAQSMPSAFSFERPYIVDPNWATGVAEQSLEKAELASKKFDVESDTLKATTIGGYLNVSQQLLSLQPGSLQIIIDQLNWRLSRSLDVFALTEAKLSTGHVALANGAPADDVLQALYDASVEVYEATGSPGEWVAMGPKGWARLGGLTDLALRPLFPSLGAANAIGTAQANDFASLTGPAGLRPIITPAIVDDQFYVGNRYGLEGYLYQYPVLEAVEPSVLGRQVAVAASIIAHRPTPTANSIIRVGP